MLQLVKDMQISHEETMQQLVNLGIFYFIDEGNAATKHCMMNKEKQAGNPTHHV